MNFDQSNIDWNQTYLNFLPQVLNTKSTEEYYKVLIRFYALLKDGHTNVYPPDSIAPDFYSRPPIRCEIVEGHILVTQVFSDSLLKVGIKPGLEVLTIDSLSAVAYVPAEENSTQGGELSTLYSKLNTGDQFLVLPVPKDEEPDTQRQPSPIPFPMPSRQTVRSGAQVGLGVAIGIGVYETVKWGAAIFFAPETLGGSLGAAAATP